MLKPQIWIHISQDLSQRSFQRTAQSHQWFTNPAQRDFKYYFLLSSCHYHRSPKQCRHPLSSNCGMTQRTGWEQHHVLGTGNLLNLHVISNPSLKQVTFSGGWAEKVIHATTFVFQQIAISCPKLNQKVQGSSHHFGSNFQTAWKRGKK